MRAPIKEVKLACEEYLRTLVNAQKLAKKAGKARDGG